MFRTLVAFLCLTSIAMSGEFTSKISQGLALEIMKPKTVDVAKVPRSQCPYCKGTGKVKVGDTVTVKIAECEHCYDDGKKSGDTAPAESLPAPPTEEKPVEVPSAPAEVSPGPATKAAREERGRRMIYVHAEWCVKCKPVEKNIFPLMRRHRWRIGNEPTDQIQCIDEKELTEKTANIAINDVTSYPTFIVIEDGYEIARYSGYLNQWQIGELFNRKVTPAAKSKPVEELPGGLFKPKLGHLENVRPKISQLRQYLRLVGDKGSIEVKPDKPGQPVKYQINDKTSITFGMPFKLRYEINGDTISLIFVTPPPVTYRVPIFGDKAGQLCEVEITTDRINVKLAGMPDGYMTIGS